MRTEKSVDLLKEIESKYNVSQIAYDGIKLWPIFRVYIGSQLHFDKDRSVRLNRKIASKGLLYFFLGFRNIFKSFDYLSFTSSDQRKEIEGLMLERADFIDEKYGKKLSVETPSLHHFSKKLYKSPMTSHMFLYALEFVLSKFTILNASKFSGLDELNSIMKSYNVSIDPRYLTKRFKAQFRVINALNKRWQVNRVFMTTPYTKYGYVYYFKSKGIPVIEFQHGVITNSHNAYNVFKRLEDRFYPDYLFTFGETEKDVFEKSVYIDQKNCFAVGSFYIDHIARMEEKNLIKERYPAYKKYIALVLQDMYEVELFEFMKHVFPKSKQTLFILIPRNNDEAYYRKNFEIPENAKFIKDLNTYQIIKMSDVHTTINSTTALEAPSLGVPNILINSTGLAKQYYGDVLVNPELNKYAQTPDDYIDILDMFQNLDPNLVKKGNDRVFRTNFTFNLNEALSQLDGDIKE
jgi:hypothetical protein